jgi:hypothetical protein
MYNKRIFDLITLGLWVCVAIVLYVQNGAGLLEKIKIPENSFALRPNNELDIKKISVISGDSIDITLQNKIRIFAKLSVLSIEGSKQRVISLLNSITSPKVLLLKKQQDGRWLVSINFMLDGKETKLEDWLLSNNLVYR